MYLVKRFVQVGCVVVVAFTLMSNVDRLRAAETLTFVGYPDCILLKNESTRVVLCPHAGGRVLEYSLGDKNALYLEEETTGKDYVPGRRASMSAGRFDIGPEKIIPRRDLLWSGRWRGEITGERSAKLTSQKDAATGVQLVREFKLARTGTHLACRQTIINVSDRVTEWCHWSRTFALGNGIVVIPLKGISKYPNKYVMYDDGDHINLKPTDPHIRQRDGCLEITGVPAKPKLGMDSQAGWFAYLMKNDVMFIKKFDVEPNRVYNEAAGLTISIWYPEDRRVELEPIGPREHLKPGESASFTENWYLRTMSFPQANEKVDLSAVKAAAMTAK